MAETLPLHPKLTLKQVLSKYLDGAVKWAKKERDMLEMMNKHKDFKMPLKIYIGIDKLAGQLNE